MVGIGYLIDKFADWNFQDIDFDLPITAGEVTELLTGRQFTQRGKRERKCFLCKQLFPNHCIDHFDRTCVLTVFSTTMNLAYLLPT